MQLRRILVVAAGALLFGSVHSGVAAAAGNLSVHPSFTGAGAITAPNRYGCAMKPGGAVKNSDLQKCPTLTTSADWIEVGGIFIPGISLVSLTAAADPGWQFMGWIGCPAPSGAVCTSSIAASSVDISTSPQANFAEIVPVALGTKPAEYTNNRRPTFTYSSTVAGTQFECTFDSAAATCPGTTTGSFQPAADLVDGKHSFKVTGSHNGNPSLAPVSYAFIVDTAAPDTSINSATGPGEGALQTVTTETFTFASTEPSGGSFECRIDAAAFSKCASPLVVSGLSPGKHTFEVRGRDRAGNTDPTPAKRSWTIAIPDNDGDGFNANIDCDDANPQIHPGANDPAGNGIDENCDGADTPLPTPGTTSAPPAATAPPEQIVVTLAYFASAKRTSTRFTTLQVKNIPFGATVTATCKGKRCPAGLKRKGFTKRNAFGTLSLAKFIKKPLRAGITITVTVSKPGAINAVKILSVRASKKPRITTKCHPPGTKAPVSC